MFSARFIADALPITSKKSPCHKKKDREINFFTLSSLISWSFNLSFTFAFKKRNGVLGHFNFSEFIFLSKERCEIGVRWSIEATQVS